MYGQGQDVRARQEMKWNAGLDETSLQGHKAGWILQLTFQISSFLCQINIESREAIIIQLEFLLYG